MVPILGTRFGRKHVNRWEQEAKTSSRLLLQLRHGYVLPRAVGADDHAHTPPPSVRPHAATTAAWQRRLLRASQGRSNSFLQHFLAEDGCGWNGQAHDLVGTDDVVVRGPILPETGSASERLRVCGVSEVSQVVHGVVSRCECNILGYAQGGAVLPNVFRYRLAPDSVHVRCDARELAAGKAKQALCHSDLQGAINPRTFRASAGAIPSCWRICVCGSQQRTHRPSAGTLPAMQQSSPWVNKEGTPWEHRTGASA